MPNAIVSVEGLTLFAKVVADNFSPCTLRLFKELSGGGPLTANSVFQNLVEADFDGYASHTYGDATDGYDPVGINGFNNFPAHTFTKAAGANTNTIKGWVLTVVDAYAGGNKIVCGVNFTVPLFFGTPGDNETITPSILFPPVP